MSENEIPKDIPFERLTWKQVNLLDPISTEQFLDGCETLIYLIHSLHVDNFEQLDIQLANAAGTAAAKKGVKKIIYMGGIVPANQKASPHLTSRAETGKALATHGIPVAKYGQAFCLRHAVHHTLLFTIWPKNFLL